MVNKEEAITWAEKVLQETDFEENGNQLVELMLYGSLMFDKDGNWIPISEFEIKSTNGKILL